MKKLIFTALFAITALFGSAQEQADSTFDCKKFHTGSFQMVGKNSHVIISRTETTQTETNTKTGEENTYSIIWITDCKFELSPTSEKDIEFFKGRVFVGEIIEIKDNTYTCKAGLSGEKMTVTDQIRKIN